MFNLNPFKSKPNTKVLTILSQSRLLLDRLNKDPDMDIPKVRTLLKKEYKDFDDEVFSTVSSALLLGKKVAEFKSLNYEMDSWFETQLESAVDHTFSILTELKPESVEEVFSFVTRFYSPVESTIK